MKIRSRPLHTNVFPLVVGSTDGIMTALALASGRLMSGGPLGISMAVKVAAASALSGVFVFFTAEYFRFRGELVRAERELSLSAHGIMASTQLGRAVRQEAFVDACMSCCSNFAGALFPLLLGVVLPGPRWLPMAAAVLILGFLGGILARSVHASSVFWSLTLILLGALVAYVGTILRIV